MRLSPQPTTDPVPGALGADLTDAESAAQISEAGAEQTKGLFEDHVPMSLIMDLTPPGGPHSRDILDAEGGPEDAWWEPA
jgi:hypothetical protein